MAMPVSRSFRRARYSPPRSSWRPRSELWAISGVGLSGVALVVALVVAIVGGGSAAAVRQPVQPVQLPTLSASSVLIAPGHPKLVQAYSGSVDIRPFAPTGTIGFSMGAGPDGWQRSVSLTTFGATDLRANLSGDAVLIGEVTGRFGFSVPGSPSTRLTWPVGDNVMELVGGPAVSRADALSLARVVKRGVAGGIDAPIALPSGWSALGSFAAAVRGGAAYGFTVSDPLVMTHVTLWEGVDPAALTFVNLSMHATPTQVRGHRGWIDTTVGNSVELAWLESSGTLVVIDQVGSAAAAGEVTQFAESLEVADGARWEQFAAGAESTSR